jgi:outer membrane protein OmpA-like peptidoglycan-associated protein
MKLNTLLKYSLVLSIASIGFTSCTSSGDNAGIEYAPNMYRSQAYEPFTQDHLSEYNPYGMTMRLPVRGTIARGQGGYLYPHANTGDGYEASASYASWVPSTEKNVREGERLYTINCQQCHGKSGGNDGAIFKSKKMPGPSWPNYQSEYIQTIPQGKIYHTITYGKGLMGSHAAMLTPEERWKVISYVKELSVGKENFKYAEEVSSVNINNGDANLHNSGDNTGSAVGEFTPEMQTKVKSFATRILFQGLPKRKELKNSSFAVLDELAEMLKANPNARLKIIGNTGAILTEAGAETLGMDRASTVKAYLISKGVNAAKLNAQSAGNDKMDGNIVDAEAKSENRNVELILY